MFVQASDGSFIEESSDCFGTDQAVLDSRSCTIDLSTLTAAPFSLQLADPVIAKVVAQNAYGDSDPSEPGSGAVI